jgi:hypothetical protein
MGATSIPETTPADLIMQEDNRLVGSRRGICEEAEPEATSRDPLIRAIGGPYDVLAVGKKGLARPRGRVRM